MHACVRDASDPAKVDHLKALSAVGDPALTTGRSPDAGEVKIFEADLTVAGSCARSAFSAPARLRTPF